jgi:hypothetical protein
MTWYVKARYQNGEIAPILVDDPKKVLEHVAEQRAYGRLEVWIEDANGKRVDESAFQKKPKS